MNRVERLLAPKYRIMVIDFNGHGEVEGYDNEEDFGHAYADYCALGYNGRIITDNYALVRRVRGA